MKRFPNISVWAAFAAGAAGVFDLFGQSGPVIKLGTLADDVARVGDDFKAVGDDFAAILARQSPNRPHD
jgi:hypothetical protein